MKRIMPVILAFVMMFTLSPAATAAVDASVTRVTDNIYEAVSPFSDGLAAVKLNGKWGYIDETGDTAIGFNYDYAWPFHEGYALVMKTEFGPDPSAWWTADAPVRDLKVMYRVDKNGGEMRLQYVDTAVDRAFPIYETAADFDPAEYGSVRFNDGAMVVGGRVICANGCEMRPNEQELGALIYECQEKGMWWITEKSACAASTPLCVDGKVVMELRGAVSGSPSVFFLMNILDGSIARSFPGLTPTEYEYGEKLNRVTALYPPVDGLMCARYTAYTIDGSPVITYGMLDAGTLGWRVAAGYTDFRYMADGVFFSDGLWVVRDALGRYGAVDKKGAAVIPFVYDYLTAFVDGLAGAVSSGVFCYVDTSNNRYGVEAPEGVSPTGVAVGSQVSSDMGVVADGALRAWCVLDTPVDGVLPWIRGSETLAPEVYFSDLTGGASAVRSVRGVSDILAVRGPDGKYGFVRLTRADSGANPYHDVYPGAFYYEPALWAAGAGLADTSSGLFAPTEGASRAAVVEYLWKAAGRLAPTVTENPFADISAADSCYTAALWAYGMGITTGIEKDGVLTFSPAGALSRAETLTFLHRAAGEPEAETPAVFDDVPAGAYYADAVSWAVSLPTAITQGVSTGSRVFNPGGSVTNSELVTFLYRWFVRNNGTVKEPPDPDAETEPDTETKPDTGTEPGTETDPDTETEPDTGTDPDTEADPDTGTGTDPDAQETPDAGTETDLDTEDTGDTGDTGDNAGDGEG